MRAKYGILFFLLASTILCRAQSNYKEGSVVTNDRDTIKGFINYREWHKNPDKIQFKRDLNKDEVQTFTTDSIAGFSITGFESYARYTVSVSLDEINFKSLRETIDTTTVTKTVFLKIMARGDRVDLYSYTDEIKIRFYILDKRQTTPSELVYRKYLNNGQELTQALYQQQLSGLAHDYGIADAGLEESITKANYSGKEIRNIISKINTQNESSNSVTIDKKGRWNFFLGAGITASTMNYTGESLIMMDGINDMDQYKYKDKITTHSYLPRISAGADFYINPAIRRLIIRGEISASNIKSTVNSYYKFNQYSTNETDNTYRFAAWNIGLGPHLIFNVYNTNKYRWYLGAGFLVNYLVVTDNSMERKDHQTGSFIDKTEDYLSINTFAMNAILRTGFLVNDRVDLSLIWTSPQEYTNYIVGGQFIKTTLLSFAVGYYFKK